MSAAQNEQDIIDGLNEIYGEFGVAATLTRSGLPVYDPSTGSTPPGTPETLPVMVILGEREQTIENGAIVIIDTIEARTELRQGDLIQIGARKFNVTAVNEDAPFGNVIEWQADVEGQAV